MVEPVSSEAMKPEFRSGESSRRDDERTNLDEPTPVAVQARRSSLIDRFLQYLKKKPRTDQVTELSQ